jgi:hypothetical protein
VKSDSALLMQLLGRLDKVAKGEKVIGPMNETVQAAFIELEHMRVDLEALCRKAKKQTELLEARRTLFWELVRNECEQAESAESRDLSIGVRKRTNQDGIEVPVVVEFKAKEEGGHAAAFLDMLKQLRHEMGRDQE